MSIGNTSLHQSGEIPEIVKLPNGRIRVTRRFHKFTREDIDNANLGSLMGDFGDLDTTGEQISNQGYTNCRLISVEVDTRFNSVSNTDSAVLVKTYETLTAVWTKEQDDEVTSTDNGLRVLERSEVAAIDTAAPYDEDDVGVATITDGGKTLYLAGFTDETQSETNVQIGRVVSRWAEAGTLSEVISNNTSGIPNTKTRTVTSIGIEPTSSGILINKSQQQKSGFITYRYTFLESSSGGDPTDGVLQSYQTVIQVQKAGTIEGAVINQVAEIVQTPPTVGKVVATVSVSLTTSSTTSLPVAYNLDGVSCSATFAQTRKTPVGIEQGNSLTVSVFNTRRTASVRPFPNHYRIGSGTSFSYTTPATIIRDNDNIIGESLDETHTTSVTLTGSATAPATTGIYDEQVEPAFLDDAGVQYYRKTTYTI